MATYSPSFINSINFVLGASVEGVSSMDPKDKGNWTSGVVGKGDLQGTKWGLSAAAYPRMTIQSITREQALAIYFRDYWQKIAGDQIPQRIALVLLDAAVNQGPGAAVKMLQRTLRVQEDGVMGSQTIAAARSAQDPHYLVADFLAVRGVDYAGDEGFDTDGRDWLRRCFLACQAAS